jgi:hypothetical protein
MEGLGLVAIVVFCLLQAYLGFVGLDLRKPKSWFFGALGFLCGLAAGTMIGATNLIESIGIGAIAGFWTLLAGVVTRRRKKEFGGP